MAKTQIIEIEKDGKLVQVKMRNTTGKEEKEGFKKLTAIIKEGVEDLDKLEEYTDFIDTLTAELCGMTVEELDSLEGEEKDKLITPVQKRIQRKIDFLKSSLKQES